MSTEIREIQVANDKSIFVEVEISDEDIVPQQSYVPEDLPPGAEPTMTASEIINAMTIFQNNIEGIALMVRNSLEKIKPTEWSVEMNIGFKGKATPIPFIAKAEAEGGVKVTVTWKEDS